MIISKKISKKEGKEMKIFLIIFFISLSLISLAQKELKFTQPWTPYGKFNELRAKRVGIEELWIKGEKFTPKSIATVSQMKAEINKLHSQNRAEINNLRSQTRAEINKLRSQTRAEIEGLWMENAKIKKEISEIRSNVNIVQSNLNNLQSNFSSLRSSLRSSLSIHLGLILALAGWLLIITVILLRKQTSQQQTQQKQ